MSSGLGPGFEVILRGGTVVALVERGEFCGVFRAVLFLIFGILRPELFLLILLFLYIAKVAYDYMVWFLIRSLWCGLLSFSFRAFLSDFDLRPF